MCQPRLLAKCLLQRPGEDGRSVPPVFAARALNPGRGACNRQRGAEIARLDSRSCVVTQVFTGLQASIAWKAGLKSWLQVAPLMKPSCLVPEPVQSCRAKAAEPNSSHITLFTQLSVTELSALL